VINSGKPLEIKRAMSVKMSIRGDLEKSLTMSKAGNGNFSKENNKLT